MNKKILSYFSKKRSSIVSQPAVAPEVPSPPKLVPPPNASLPLGLRQDSNLVAPAPISISAPTLTGRAAFISQHLDAIREVLEDATSDVEYVEQLESLSSDG